MINHTKSIVYNDVFIDIMDDRATNNNDGNVENKPMNVFKRIESWIKTNFAPPQPPKPDPNLAKLYELIYRARTLKRVGQYDEVLRELDVILSIVDDKMKFGIHLNQADILIRKKDFAHAATILESLDTDEQLISDEYRAHFANMWGLWWKAQQKWDEAQERFEEAIDMAKRANKNHFIPLVTTHLAVVYLEQGNASYAMHLLEQVFPLVQGSGDTELVSYFTGVYGQATLETGKPDGRQIVEHALFLAREIGHNEYQVMWLNTLAMDSMRANLFSEAIDYLSKVLEKTDPTEPVYIAGLCHISRASYHTDHEATLRYAQQAEALLTDEHPQRLKMQVYITLGTAYRVNNDGEQALHYLKQVDEALYRSWTLSPFEYRYVDYVRNLAGAYLLVSNFPQSAEIYEQALNGDGGFSEFEIANLQRDRGIYYVHLKQYQDAIQTWMNALKYYEGERLYVQVARLYSDIGNIRRLIGQGRRAFKDYEQALMVLNSFDDPETRGLVLSNAATIYADFGDITTAESFFVEAIQIAQQLRKPQLESLRRGNYGWFLLNTGRAESALHMLQHAIDQSQALNLSHQAAVQMDNMGLAWDELKNYERAIGYHQQAWQMLQDQPDIDIYWRGIIGANLAHSLISAGTFESVDDLLDVALKIGRDIQRQELVIRALNGKIRGLLLQQGDHEQVALLADEAVSLAQLQGRRRLLADALILRSQLHQKNGQDEEAEKDWESAKSILQLLRLKPADYQQNER